MKKENLKEDDTIDLAELLTKIWEGRKTVLTVTLLFVLLGTTSAFLTPNSFEASSVFITQTSEEKPASSLGGLASLAGINLGSLGGSSGISTALYPKILYSVPFKRSMLESTIMYESRSMTYAEYLKQRPMTLGGMIKKYIIGLPGQVIDWVNPNKDNEEGTSQTAYGLKISDEDYELIENFENEISLLINEEEGYITLRVKDYVPEVAAQMVILAEKQLQERVIDYQVKNTKELYEFTQAQYLELQKEVFELQDELARFTETNQNISSSFVQNQQRRLESEYDRINSVYTELALQKRQAAIQLKENTPIFSIIDPVNIPNLKAEPNRPLLIAIWLVLGMILSAGYLLVIEPLRNFIQGITDNP